MSQEGKKPQRINALGLFHVLRSSCTSLEFLLLFVKGQAHEWRFDYSFHGRRKTLSLGTYPDTSLALARRKADAARQLVAEDIDPSQKRKAEKESYAQVRVADEREEQGLPPPPARAHDQLQRRA